jgi:hypothetical protein
MQGVLDQLVQARLLAVQTGGGGGASVERATRPRATRTARGPCAATASSTRLGVRNAIPSRARLRTGSSAIATAPRRCAATVIGTRPGARTATRSRVRPSTGAIAIGTALRQYAATVYSTLPRARSATTATPQTTMPAHPAPRDSAATRSAATALSTTPTEPGPRSATTRSMNPTERTASVLAWLEYAGIAHVSRP